MIRPHSLYGRPERHRGRDDRLAVGGEAAEGPCALTHGQVPVEMLSDGEAGVTGGAVVDGGGAAAETPLTCRRAPRGRPEATRDARRSLRQLCLRCATPAGSPARLPGTLTIRHTRPVVLRWQQGPDGPARASEHSFVHRTRRRNGIVP